MSLNKNKHSDTCIYISNQLLFFLYRGEMAATKTNCNHVWVCAGMFVHMCICILNLPVAFQLPGTQTLEIWILLLMYGLKKLSSKFLESADIVPRCG